MIGLLKFARPLLRISPPRTATKPPATPPPVKSDPLTSPMPITPTSCAPIEPLTEPAPVPDTVWPGRRPSGVTPALPAVLSIVTPVPLSVPPAVKLDS